jgi:hypothetical protein
MAMRTPFSRLLLLGLLCLPYFLQLGGSPAQAEEAEQETGREKQTLTATSVITPLRDGFSTDTSVIEGEIPTVGEIESSQSPRWASTSSRYLTVVGDCIKIGVKAEGSFGNGNIVPALQYNKACNGSFPESTEYISSNAASNCRFEALALTINGELYANTNSAYDIVNSGYCTYNDTDYTTLVDSATISNKSGAVYRGTRWQNRLVTHGVKRGLYKIENDIRFNDRDKFIEMTTYVTPSIDIDQLYIARVADIDLLQVSGDTWSSYTGRGYSTLDAKFLVMVESNVSKQIAGFYTGDESTIGAGIASQDTWDPTPLRFYDTGTPGYTDSLIGITKQFNDVSSGQTLMFRYAYVFGESAYKAVSNAVQKGVAGGVPGRVPGCRGCVINDEGQIAPTEIGLPTRTNTRRPSATRTPTTTPLPFVMRKGVVGASFVLGLLKNTTLVTWGMNREYQTNIPPCCGSGITDIAAGTNFALALKNGRVYGWGANTLGQLDIPNAALDDVTAIAAGGGHALALKKNRKVYAWGSNTSKQATVPRNVANIRQIAAGTYHSLALTYSGNVVAWGENANGQRDVPRRLRGVSQVVGGMDHSVALRSNGRVVAWGGNGYGQSRVPPNATGIVQVSAGNQFTLAVKNDGTVIGWGRNENKVYTIPDEYTDIFSVAAGYANTILSLRNGRIIVLGDMLNGVGVSRTPTKTATPTP